MLRVLVVSFGLIIAANPGRADQRQDCAKLSDDAAISACDQAIGQNLRDAHLYYYRGKAYSAKCEYDRTIADYKKVIELNLMKDPIGCHRGNVYSYRGA
jgi:tetratricopeptide (TPR) repeat protein